MTVAKSTSRHPAGGPMTLAIGWPHEGGEFPEIRPHDRGDRQISPLWNITVANIGTALVEGDLGQSSSVSCAGQPQPPQPAGYDFLGPGCIETIHLVGIWPNGASWGPSWDSTTSVQICAMQGANGGACLSALSSHCPSSYTWCAIGAGGTCANLSSDPNHCGSCTPATACPVGGACCNGTCCCPTGTTNCSGVCRNLATDPSHCGSCTTTVCPANGSCVNGTCSTALYTIPGALVSDASPLLNAQLFLNNYQTKRDPTNPALAFDARNSSYVNVSLPGRAASVNPFDLPPIGEALTLAGYGASSTQVALSTTPSTGPSALALTINVAPFRLMTNCVNNIVCIGDPNFILSNTVVMLDLFPSVANGRLDYTNPTTTALRFDLSSAPGLCENNLFAFICDALKDAKLLFHPAAKTAIGNAFNGAEVHGKLSTALDCAVRSLSGITKPFVSASIVNGDLV